MFVLLDKETLFQTEVYSKRKELVPGGTFFPFNVEKGSKNEPGWINSPESVSICLNINEKFIDQCIDFGVFVWLEI